jgi:hypothetical protein
MSVLLLLSYIIKLIFVTVMLMLRIMKEQLSKIISSTLPNNEYEREDKSRDD